MNMHQLHLQIIDEHLTVFERKGQKSSCKDSLRHPSCKDLTCLQTGLLELHVFSVLVSARHMLSHLMGLTCQFLNTHKVFNVLFYNSYKRSYFTGLGLGVPPRKCQWPHFTPTELFFYFLFVSPFMQS